MKNENIVTKLIGMYPLHTTNFGMTWSGEPLRKNLLVMLQSLVFILLTIDPLGIQEPIELCEHHTFLLQDFYDVAHLTLGGINRPKPSIYYMYIHTSISEVSVHHLRPRNRMTKQYYSKGFKGWITFYKLIFLRNYSMKLRGLPTIKHILVLLYKACRT